MNCKIKVIYILAAVIFVSLLFSNHVRAATNKDFTISAFYFLPGCEIDIRDGSPNCYTEIKNGGFDLEIPTPIGPNYVDDPNQSAAVIANWCELHLSQADKSNLKIMFATPYFWVQKMITDYPNSRQTVIDGFKDCVKKHPSFWGFYNLEEANYAWKGSEPIPILKSGYDMIKAAMPNANIFQALANAGNVDRLKSTIVADAAGIIIYPITTYTPDPCGSTDPTNINFYNGLPSGTPCDVNIIGSFTDNVKSAAGDKPVWMILQAYDARWDDPALPAGKTLPNYTDLHAMAYSAITHGANGIVWWGFQQSYAAQGLSTNSQIYKDVVKVNLELQSIKPILSSSDAGFKFTVDTPDIDQIVKFYQNNYYVILLNRKDSSVAYRMSLGSISSTQGQNVLSGSSFNIMNNQLTETLSAHDIRVYKIQPSANSSLVQNVIWTNAVGVSVNGNSLTKTSADGHWDAGASSVQSISSGDGYVEFSSNEVNTHKMGGLSNGDTDQNYNDISFGVFPAGNTIPNVYIYEAGSCKYGPLQSGCSTEVNTQYSAGDVFRVAVVSGKVKYYQNGMFLYANNNPALVYPLLFDTSLFSTGATITNAKIAIIPPPVPPPSPVLFPPPSPTPVPTPSPIPVPSPTPTPPPTTIPDGTLVKSGSTIYVIDNGVKRGFTSMKALNDMGYKLSNVSTVNPSSIPEGPVISNLTRHPRGTLVITKGTVYFLGKDLRYPFPSEEVFLSWGNRFQEVVLANSFDLQLTQGPIVQTKQ